jgi:hypothetical protein
MSAKLGQGFSKTHAPYWEVNHLILAIMASRKILNMKNLKFIKYLSRCIGVWLPRPSLFTENIINIE